MKIRWLKKKKTNDCCIANRSLVLIVILTFRKKLKTDLSLQADDSISHHMSVPLRTFLLAYETYTVYYLARHKMQQ